MIENRVRIFPGLEELSLAAAERFLELAALALTTKACFCVALSGGSTTRRLYQLLASSQFASRIAWEKVQLFQVDERCVPPDDPESNYHMMREALLVRAPIPEANFHRLRAELPDRQEAARLYAEELDRVLQPRAGEWPRFDLVILGMGADGHTASLFPGTPALSEATLWVMATSVPTLGTHRLTLTLPVLNAAAEVIFLVSGAEKAKALATVLGDSPAALLLPAQLVRPVLGDVWWYVDQAAAQCLPAQWRTMCV